MMYSNYKIVLEPLIEKDAEYFYDIYSHPAIVEYLNESPFLPNETPKEFTKRLISLCEFIFTIRPADNPNLIIGDCALHHWNREVKEVMIGGSLLPNYWGQGYMRAAFELLTEIAKDKLGAKALIGSTKTRNLKAIRFIEKLDFVKYKFDEENTIMRKVVL